MTNTMTQEEFEALLENSYTYKLNVADIVKGVVVKREKDGFLVDIGAKTEAFLPNSEVVNSKDQNPDDFIKLWDEKEFYITKDPTNLDEAVQIRSFVGRLEVGQVSDKYYLVIKMKENVGNEFQGHIYSGIGITVYAVQGNVKIEE